MSMELWTAPTPNGWKATIMIEELIEAGANLPPIEIHTVNLLAGEQFAEDFTAISPNQKIPGLRDGDTTVMESGAILLYLAEKFPSPLLPAGAARWETLQWLFWQVANLGPNFGNKLSYTRYLDDIPAEQKVHPLERFRAESQRLLRVLDRQLEGRPYICGEDFTIADIASYPWVRGWKWSKIDITEHANVVAWVQRVRARPAVGRGLAYGANPGEVDQWSEATKARYASSGATIASNANIDAEK